jgi:hypothetical protein
MNQTGELPIILKRRINLDGVEQPTTTDDWKSLVKLCKCFCFLQEMFFRKIQSRIYSHGSPETIVIGSVVLLKLLPRSSDR